LARKISRSYNPALCRVGDNDAEFGAARAAGIRKINTEVIRIESIPWRRYARCAIAFASAAARCMLDDISLVTVLCSSTAAAVAVTYSLTP
jgi:hypothetical protein